MAPRARPSPESPSQPQNPPSVPKIPPPSPKSPPLAPCAYLRAATASMACSRTAVSSWSRGSFSISRCGGRERGGGSWHPRVRRSPRVPPCLVSPPPAHLQMSAQVAAVAEVGEAAGQPRLAGGGADAADALQELHLLLLALRDLRHKPPAVRGGPQSWEHPPHPTHSPPAPSFYLHPGLDKLVDGVHGLLLQHVHLQVVEGCGQRARGAIRGGAGDPPGGWGGAGCLCEREGVLHSRPRGTATSSSSSSSGVM